MLKSKTLGKKGDEIVSWKYLNDFHYQWAYNNFS